MGFNDPQFIDLYEKIDGERTEDIEFYLNLARKAQGKVLDAGCGSGRLLIPLLNEGIDAEGFDSSEAMLDVLRQKLDREGLEAKFMHSSLESFRPLKADYHLIVCAYNTFLHILDQRSQIAVLQSLKGALVPGGTLALDIMNPANYDIYEGSPAKKVFEATYHDQSTDESTSIWRWFEQDVIEQRAIYHREYVTQKDGSPEKKRESAIEFRWTYPSEMRLLLMLAGFNEIQCYGDFDRGELTDESLWQVWTAKKPAENDRNI